MRQLARFDEELQVTLSGFFGDVERSGGIEVGWAVESFWQCCQELFAGFGCDYLTAFQDRCLGVARQRLKDSCRVLQQDFDHGQGGVEVGIGADQPLDVFQAFAWCLVDEAKDAEDHREAKEDEAEATDGGHDFVAKQLSEAKLGGFKEVVELVHLGEAESELDRPLGELLQEGEEVAANLLELLIGGGTTMGGKHVVPDQFGFHDIEDETAEQAVFSIRDEIEDLLRCARQDSGEFGLHNLDIFMIFLSEIGNRFMVKRFPESVRIVAQV